MALKSKFIFENLFKKSMHDYYVVYILCKTIHNAICLVWTAGSTRNFIQYLQVKILYQSYDININKIISVFKSVILMTFLRENLKLRSFMPTILVQRHIKGYYAVIITILSDKTVIIRDVTTRVDESLPSKSDDPTF